MPPETLDSLDKDDLKPLVLRLLAQIADLIEQNKTLLARIAELEARLKIPPKTPDNSPSKGSKANRPEKAKKPRKGRPGVARALCPNPDVVRDIYATHCDHCGKAVGPEHQSHVHAAWDHVELVLRSLTTRVNQHRGDCPCCGQAIVAGPPADMAPGSPFGQGLVAFVIYMHTTQMVSYNRLVEMLKGLFGLDISEGAIANMLARAARPFAAEAEKIAAHVRSSPVIASDETSARVEGKTHWQWVFGSASAVYHTIADSRGAAVVSEFLEGARPKVWISDRLAAQMGHADAHQVCLAHLLRDAQYAIDAGDTTFAPGFKGLLKRACAIGRRRDDLADPTLKAYARDLERRLGKLMAADPDTAQGRKLQGGIIRCRDKLFVFVTRRDVSPTNNASEQRLRPSVIFRKVTNGFRSQWGAKVYADIRSIVATGLLHGRTALQSIRDALAGRPAAA